MTKEEIIQAIFDDKMMPFIQPDQLAQIVDFVIKNYTPSLPSDLDEAALKELQVYLPQGNGPDGIYYFIAAQMLAMYKAGAEWMAEKGASFNTKVGWIDGPTILDWPDDILDKFEMGDDVIVQIRKKQ